MNITEPGKITERITLLGRFESCVQLLDGGDEAVLLGGSMAYVVPDILEQIERFGIDERKISRLIILHSHFDHCGIIPYLKKRWPWAKVTASTRAKELLSDVAVSQKIVFLNQAATMRYQRQEEVKKLGCEFTKIEVDQTVQDGEVLACGDLSIKFLAVPGHSSCSLSAYVPEEKALFASDASGVSYKNAFFSTGNSNFDLYEQSLRKMASLDVEILLREHYGVIKGEEARTAIDFALEKAAEDRVLLEKTYQKTLNIHKATEEVVDTILSRWSEDFLPRDVVTMVVSQMIKFISKKQKLLQE